MIKIRIETWTSRPICSTALLAAALLSTRAAAVPQSSVGGGAGAGGSDAAWPALVAAGAAHSLASVNGDLLAWGANAFGQLGLPTNLNPRVPTAVSLPFSDDVIAVSAGNLHTLLLDAQGRVWSCGSNQYGQLGDGTFADSSQFRRVVRVGDGQYLGGVIEIEAGGSHSLALDSSGSVWAWGNNNHGQLGAAPSTPKAFARRVTFPAGLTPYHVSGGYYHSLAILRTTTGTPLYSLYAWGRNLEGQLGQGDYLDRSVPTLTPNPYINPTEDLGLSGGSYFSTISHYSERTFGCGWDYFGQVRILRTPDDEIFWEPWLVQKGSAGLKFTQLACGGGHVLCGTDASGYSYLYGWGLNSSGQLGRGNTTNSDERVLVCVTPGVRLENVKSVAAGDMHSLALTSDGSIYAWGENQNGQLGDGSTIDRIYASRIWP